jgi:demethylmenaquinone methyltransferase / 2-methoxy-6-polyprenyl-1,4-benzoquinol methylase
MSEAWNEESLRDPHAVADKRSRVQRMFAAIAPAYDFNNRLHSFWQDQRWRRRAVRLAEVKADDRIVDVACGTGDLALLFARELRVRTAGHPDRMDLSDVEPPQAVVGIDFTLPMLPIAVEKTPRVRTFGADAQGLWDGYFTGNRYVNADATALPLADASADVVSIAFGLRNVQEPHKALAEFHRVLRPGGRVIVLEFSQPKNRLIRFFNDLYCAKIMPHTATWLSGDKSGAYKYLPMSVATFMNREQMKQALRDAGFVDVTEHPMTFGVAVVYRGYKR